MKKITATNMLTFLQNSIKGSVTLFNLFKKEVPKLKVYQIQMLVVPIILSGMIRALIKGEIISLAIGFACLWVLGWSILKEKNKDGIEDGETSLEEQVSEDTNNVDAKVAESDKSDEKS